MVVAVKADFTMSPQGIHRSLGGHFEWHSCDIYAREGAEDNLAITAGADLLAQPDYYLMALMDCVVRVTANKSERGRNLASRRAFCLCQGESSIFFVAEAEFHHQVRTSLSKLGQNYIGMAQGSKIAVNF